jgi:glutamyl/glutaminyl-tRNA synthetase
MSTRLAPTPSGYLHAGNCFNFLVTQLASEIHDLPLGLRIDADDRERIRGIYEEDIYRVIAELDITPSFILHPTHGFAERWENCRQILLSSITRGLVLYSCHCSRSELRAGKSCQCKQTREWSVGTSIKINAEESGLDTSCDGFTLWRASDQPSSVLAGIADDHHLETTLIIRGEDLSTVTDIESAIRPFLLGPMCPKITVVHHPLMRNENGEKLSKSAGNQSKPLRLTDDLVDDLRARAVDFASKSLKV